YSASSKACMCRSIRPPAASSKWTSEWWTVPRAQSKSARRVSPVAWPASCPTTCTLGGGGRELQRGLRRVGERRRERSRLDRVQLCGDVGLDGVQLVRAGSVLEQPSTRDAQRVALAPAVELALRPVLARVAARVPDEAVRERLDERRSLAAADGLERSPRRLAHGPQVVAVDDLRRQLERLDAADRVPRRHVLRARVLAVDVVLADVQGGKREDARDVEALVEVRLVDGAVAEEGDGDAAGVAQREGGSGRGRDAAADDPVAAEQA